MKTLRCTSCGANLNVGSNTFNAKCDYCDTVVRVVGDSEYNSINIINAIDQLAKGDYEKKIQNLYERAKMNIEKHAYVTANDILNQIIETDFKQARAWFYKSLLPILEQESVLFHGVYINVTVISKLTKREDISSYLSMCGLSRMKHRKFMRFYGSKDFLYEQQLKYIDKAIEYSDGKWTDFLKSEKEIIVRRQQKKIKKHKIVNTLIITGTLALALTVIILFRYVLEDTLLWLTGNNSN